MHGMLHHLVIGGLLPWPPLGLWPGVDGGNESVSLLVAAAGTCRTLLPVHG